MKRIFLTTLIFIFVAILYPTNVEGIGGGNNTNNDGFVFSLDEIETNITGFKFAGADIGTVLTTVFSYVLTFSGIGLLLYLLSGGFKLMTAAGDPKKMQEGQHIITNAFIGFVIVFISFWLVQLIANILGLTPIVDIFG